VARFALLLGVVCALGTAGASAAPRPGLLVVSTTYTRWSDTHVFVTAPGGRPRSLAVGTAPAVAPDGGSIAYLVSDASSHEALWTMRPDGSSKRKLADVHPSFAAAGSLAWTGDGREIVVPGSQSVDVVDADRGTITHRSDVFALAYSPDGRRVATLTAAADVAVAAADGSDPHVLLAGVYGPIHFAWSGDSRRVAFAAYGSSPVVYVANADGSGLQSFREHGRRASEPAWSGSDRLAWVDESRLRIVELGAPPRTVATIPDAAPGIAPVWAADGRTVLLAVKGGFVRVDVRTRRTTRLPVRSPAHRVTADFSVVGTWIVYAAVAPVSDLEIGLVRTDGSGFRAVTSNGSADDAPSWSPDGRTIVFARRNGKAGIYTVSAAGGSERRVAVGDAEAPAFSPDGRSIAFTVPHAIVLLRLGGVRRTLATTDLRVHALSWTPDARSIVFSEKGAIRRVDVASGAVTTIAIDAAVGSFFNRPRVSPDGTEVAFQGYVNAKTFRDPDAYGLYVAGLDGSHVRKIGAWSFPTSWAPDGSTVAASDGQRLTLVPVDGTPSAPILPPLGGGFGGSRTPWGSFRP
jgi:Tol biopolymer transport system component